MRRWSFSTFCRRVRGQLLVVLLCTIAFLVGGWLLRRLIYEAAVSEEKGGGRRLGSLCTLPPHLCVLLWKGGWRKAITFVRKAPSWPTSFLCEPRGCFEANSRGAERKRSLFLSFCCLSVVETFFPVLSRKNEKRPSSPPSGNENGPFSFRRNFQIQLLLPPLDSVQHPSIY